MPFRPYAILDAPLRKQPRKLYDGSSYYWCDGGKEDKDNDGQNQYDVIARPDSTSCNVIDDDGQSELTETSHWDTSTELSAILLGTDCPESTPSLGLCYCIHQCNATTDCASVLFTDTTGSQSCELYDCNTIEYVKESDDNKKTTLYLQFETLADAQNMCKGENDLSTEPSTVEL